MLVQRDGFGGSLSCRGGPVLCFSQPPPPPPPWEPGSEFQLRPQQGIESPGRLSAAVFLTLCMSRSLARWGRGGVG